MDGFGLARGDILGYIDADGSHRPEAISQLLDRCKDGFEMVAGSRYTVGGSISGWPLGRRVLSRVLTVLTRSMLKLPISDPMSRLFLLQRAVYESLIRRRKPSRL